MELYPSNFWFNGACFKCVNYIIGQRKCTKHNIQIVGDAAHRCEEYELDRTRWHDEHVQKWEHDKGFDKPTQTTMEDYQ